MAAAEDDHVHLGADEFLIQRSKGGFFRPVESGFRRNGLAGEGQGLQGLKGALLGLVLFLQSLFHGTNQAVAHQGNHDQQVRREMMAGVQDGVGRPVLQEHVGSAHEHGKDHVTHETQHMVEGQEGQGFTPGVHRVDNPGVNLEKIIGVQRLGANCLAVVGKDAAGAGGAAGAHGGIFAPDRGETDGARSFPDGFKIDLAYIAGESPGLQGNDLAAVRFVQQALNDVVRRGRIQQQGVMSGAHDAPVQRRPVVAGVHGNADPAFFKIEGVKAGGIVVRPEGHFRIGAGSFLFSFQPVGGGCFPVVPEDVKQGGQRLVSFQSAANRLRVKIAHESLLPFRFKSDILTRRQGRKK